MKKQSFNIEYSNGSKAIVKAENIREAILKASLLSTVLINSITSESGQMWTNISVFLNHTEI